MGSRWLSAPGGAIGVKLSALPDANAPAHSQRPAVVPCGRPLPFLPLAPWPLDAESNRSTRVGDFLTRLLKTVLLRGRNTPLDAGPPATVADFIGVDEVIRIPPASRTFQRHEPRHSANMQTKCAGAHLHRLAEFCAQLPLVQRGRFLACKEKWPGTKQHNRSSH
jgi:hypothetical protein